MELACRRNRAPSDHQRRAVDLELEPVKAIIALSMAVLTRSVKTLPITLHVGATVETDGRLRSWHAGTVTLTTRHNRYGAEDLARLEEIVARLRHVLGPLARWQAAYLHQIVLLLSDHAASFKSARPAARPSELIQALERTYKNPGRMTERLVGADVTRDEAWHVVDTDATAVILLHHYARMIWGDQAERHLGKESDALDHLRACPDPANAIKASAKRALKVLNPQRPRGRGGRRHTRDTALKLANEHILDVYVTITRQLPPLSVLSKSKNPAVQIKGAAVEFLEICLAVMGLRTSRPTLRRCIEDYRRKMQLKRPEAKEIAAPQTMKQ